MTKNFQWIVTIDDWPVVGTNAYSRKDAISKFCVDEKDRDWKSYKAAGYKTVRVKLKVV